MNAAVNHYLQDINRHYAKGDATEHTYRGALAHLVQSLNSEVLATNEPKRQQCGAPDFVLTKKNIPIGYIEAKDIGVVLSAAIYAEQLTRYKTALDNLIITDYLDFYFYKDGECVERVRIGTESPTKNRIVPLPENFAKFESLLKNFCGRITQSIKSPEKLAQMMASKARLLANVIQQTLEYSREHGEDTTLSHQFSAFEKILIHDLTIPQFADLYAQTITYGMFAARLHDTSPDTFTRQEAALLLPKTNPFLRKLFQYIAGYDVEPNIVWIIDDLADLFRATNIAQLLKGFGKATQQENAIIHFYETFLSAYDPALRKARGVWYTPAPVVNFMVRAVDDILKAEFNLPQGLADKSKIDIKIEKNGKKNIKEAVHMVQILDPASGTGTFLAEVIRHIHSQFKSQQGLWGSYVENHLIPRLNGFELLMASYAMAHLQLDLLLQETGYTPKSGSQDQRFRVYLTNSLEEYHPDSNTLFATWLSNEANEANAIKRDTPVMVVLGNPPYSGESANKGDWIMRLMEDYKKEPDGKEKLQERNPKWINDDYVKFLRFGQYFVEKNGTGVLAFINPHGFLDNPTFRGMRWNLLKTYDKIYTIDLHGNSKKKETAPDGSADENVFDIMQGVSINILVKTGKKDSSSLGQVFHFDLFGKRKEKYRFLETHHINTVGYQLLPNVAPNYFFVPKNFTLLKSYKKGFSINNLFKINSVGIVTARDEFTIYHNQGLVKKTIDAFLAMDDENARVKFNLGKDVRDWKVAFARKDLRAHYPSKKGKFCKVSYRPFDDRWTYYTGQSKGFHCYPRYEVMRHFLAGGNVGLVSVSKQPASNPTSYYFISENIISNGYIRSDSVSIDSIFPLYLYPEQSTQRTTDDGTSRTPNLDEKIVQKIAKGLGLTYTPEKTSKKTSFAPIDILDYIYAVLHSPRYRKTYQEFLKIDFPRVPYPTNIKAFWRWVALGGELRQLHLLAHPALESPITQYPKDGSNVVAMVRYEDGKAHINPTQYFGGVPSHVWEFYIGGYQPAQKWLKDRKGNTLSFEDIVHYQKIIVALARTHEIMQDIDKD